MSVFVDTSALYAVLDRDDRFHERAAATWRELVGPDGETLVTTAYVLVETVGLIRRRLGLAATRAFLESVQPVLEPIWPSGALHRKAQGRLLREEGSGLSLVDCVSFEAMAVYDIHRAFAFDPQFAEAGFVLIP